MLLWVSFPQSWGHVSGYSVISLVPQVLTPLGSDLPQFLNLSFTICKEGDHWALPLPRLAEHVQAHGELWSLTSVPATLAAG